MGPNFSLTQDGGGFSSLQLAVNTIHASQHARVLGVVFSADLSLEKHVTNVSATGFYRLRQLQHIQRTFSTESAMTLVQGPL